MRPTVYPETMKMIVAEYQADATTRAREAAWWRADGKPFSDALERVGMATLCGKRHPHQRRLKVNALANGTSALKEISGRLSAARNFQDLLYLVRAAFEPIPGLGELAIYDAADRLRYRLGLESEHVIYLHAGARVGARRLAGGRLNGQSTRSVERDEMPEGLQHLSTHEIEDILCMYKDELLLSPQQFSSGRSSAAGRCGFERAEPRPSC